MNKELGGYSGREEASQQAAAKAEQHSYKKPSAVKFYEWAKSIGAFEKRDGSGPVLNERKQALMEAWFTTPATMEDLRSLAGGVSVGRVNQLVHDAYMKVLRNIPRTTREENGEYLGSLKYFEKPKKSGQQNP